MGRANRGSLMVAESTQKLIFPPLQVFTQTTTIHSPSDTKTCASARQRVQEYKGMDFQETHNSNKQ